MFTGQPQSGCIPAPADFDGDGKLDLSQLCGDKWYFYNPTGTLIKTICPGGTGSDYPVPADYDGDGKDDVVLYRQGAWLTFSYQTGTLTGGVFTGDPPPFTGSRPTSTATARRTCRSTRAVPGAGRSTSDYCTAAGLGEIAPGGARPRPR